MLGIVTCDKRIGGFDPVYQLVGEQKVERTINGGRTELTALLLEFREQSVSFCRLVSLQDQLKNPPAHRRQPRAAERADPLRTCEGDFYLLGGSPATCCQAKNLMSRYHSITIRREPETLAS